MRWNWTRRAVEDGDGERVSLGSYGFCGSDFESVGWVVISFLPAQNEDRQPRVEGSQSRSVAQLDSSGALRFVHGAFVGLFHVTFGL